MNTSLTLLQSIPNRLPMAIRTMLLMLVLLVTGTAIVHAQSTLLVDPAGAGGFELGSTFAANGWTVSNGANNPWILGAANTTAPFAGNSAYISTNGSTPGYSNTAIASNFFWRDIVVPSGQERVNVSFNWLSGGELDWDLWQVFLVPITTTPVGSTTYQGSGLTAIPVSLPGALLVASGNLQSTTQTFTGSAFLAAGAGSYRVVFHWKNDGSGGATPGVSIDNISVSAQASSTFTSVASGNWSASATWGGSVPSAGDAVIVAAGHTVTIDAVGQAAQSVTVAGTLTYGTTPTEFQAKDLTVATGGLVNVFSGTTGKTLRVSGNLINNGRVNTLASSTANGTLNLNGAAPQTVSGTGAWGGTVSSTTSTNEVGVIGILSITNTSTSVPRVNYTMGGTLRVRSTFTVNGAVNLNGSTWIAGNYAAMGTLTFSNNGGFINGTYGRWYTNAQTGTTITAGADPSTTASSALSLFPMLNSTGVPRYCWITRSSSTSTGNTAGEIRMTYTNEGTPFTGNAFTDGDYNVSDYWPGTWNVTTANGYVYASGTHSLVTMTPFLYRPNTGNSRLMVNGGTFVGTHQLGTGTPGAQRIGLTTAQLTSTNGFVMGIGSTDLCSPSVAAINENFDSYGTGNLVPFCWDRIVVGTASQTITSTSPASGTRNIWQSS
ncbi:MAG: G8 domain-containing protein, partial [Bacteroidota bacterium]